MNSQTERWLKQAEHDFDNAERTYKAELWDMCTFACQQAAEKGLKALILEQTGSAPPRVHSIAKLADLAGVQSDVPRQALDLDDYYVGVRYPDAVAGLPYESLGQLEAAASLEAARRVLQIVQTKLGIST